MSLILPAHLDNGRVVEHVITPAEKDFTRRLHNGDPTCGWGGEPELALCLNKRGMYEVWHAPLGQKPYRVLQFAPQHLHDNVVFKGLVAADQRKISALDELVAHNQKVDKEIEYQNEQKLRPEEERLAWALKKDLR